jgi:prepilin-type N-terminal cleavage/methylation domain-containing protein
LNKGRGQNGFTLVEVVLAILIIAGIMAVLLYFYQRTAETRELVMKESEFISVSRLFLEQITTELRTARPVEDQFMGLEGTSNSVTFVCTGLPVVSKWITSTNETVVLPPATDLKRVHYGLSGGGTNQFEAKGLDRSEEMLLGMASLAETNSVENSQQSTNLSSSTGTDLLEITNRVQSKTALLTDQIKLLQFRYWDGLMWTNNWSGMDLPLGVEISIGQQSAPAMQSEESGSFMPEIFRRVIFLANSIPVANRTTLPVEPQGPEP